jgi:hypothetical protein
MNKFAPIVASAAMAIGLSGCEQGSDDASGPVAVETVQLTGIFELPDVYEPFTAIDAGKRVVAACYSRSATPDAESIGVSITEDGVVDGFALIYNRNAHGSPVNNFNITAHQLAELLPTCVEIYAKK